MNVNYIKKVKTDKAEERDKNNNSNNKLLKCNIPISKLKIHKNLNFNNLMNISVNKEDENKKEIFRGKSNKRKDYSTDVNRINKENSLKRKIYIEGFRDPELNDSTEQKMKNQSFSRDNSIIINKSANNNLEYSYTSVDNKKFNKFSDNNNLSSTEVHNKQTSYQIPNKVIASWKKKIKPEKFTFVSNKGIHINNFMNFLDIFSSVNAETLEFKEDHNVKSDYEERVQKYSEINELDLLLNLNSKGSEYNLYSRKNQENKSQLSNQNYPMKMVDNKSFKIVNPVQNKYLPETPNNKLKNKQSINNYNKKDRNEEINLHNRQVSQNQEAHFIANNNIAISKSNNSQTALKIDNSNKINISIPLLNSKGRNSDENISTFDLFKEINEKSKAIQKHYRKFKERKVSLEDSKKEKLFSIWDEKNENLFFVTTPQKTNEITEILIKVYSIKYGKTFFKKINISELYQIRENINRDIIIKNPYFLLNLIQVTPKNIEIKNFVRMDQKQPPIFSQQMSSPKKTKKSSNKVTTEIISLDTNNNNEFFDTGMNYFDEVERESKKHELFDDISTKTINTNSINEEDENSIEL